MLLRLGALSVLVALGTGCAGAGQSPGDEPESSNPTSASASSSTPTSSPTPTAATGPCALLDDQTIRGLAGEDLQGREGTVAGSDLPACIYGRLDGVGMQVAQVPASEWARALPAAAEQLEAAGALGDPELKRQLEEAATLIERGKTVPSGRACELFTDMLELQGDFPAGSDYAITYVPNDRDPLAASGQACVNGTYTTIAVGRPDLEVGRKLEADLEAALKQALAGTRTS